MDDTSSPPNERHTTRSDFATMKRILIKMGTSVVTHQDGSAALGRVAHLVEQICDLHVRYETIPRDE